MRRNRWGSSIIAAHLRFVFANVFRVTSIIFNHRPRLLHDLFPPVTRKLTDLCGVEPCADCG